ncbi:ankyrin [Coniochaeta ligniaria NRRL 30616]|uniref:Ankyrin n=1 Tax=Coniochaeta ligniaria NRRL 30616 TaxID=1408157 RepID=A0A1J7IM31_9PEZI|nr:ankyrin [Coniochaeta ligniaria NRRL 30616]
MDPLTLIGAATSVSQILVLLCQTITTVKDFCEAVSNAPVELRRLHEKLLLFQGILEELNDSLDGYGDDAVLPEGLRRSTQSFIVSIQEKVKLAQLSCQVAYNSDFTKVRKRVLWTIRDRSSMKKLLAELKESEQSLTFIIQYATLLSLRPGHCIRKLLAQTPAYGRAREVRQTDEKAVSPAMPHSSATQQRSAAVALGSLLHLLGFYGSISKRYGVDGLMEGFLFLGYKLPTWIVAKAFEFEIRFRYITSNSLHVSYLPGGIRIQNRVPLGSPLLTASRNGDVAQIAQILRDGRGSVRDRSACSGKTPLLLAIESNQVDAVQVLLEAGADPNVGDDQRVLPVFSAAGMRPRHLKYLGLRAHFPPLHNSWLDIFRLLVKHGASVHEVVFNKSLSTLDVVTQHPIQPRTLEFFHILHEEGYMDFEMTDRESWAAIVIAARSRNDALGAMKFLAGIGVNIHRIFPDGRTALHFAAEFCQDDQLLAYLCASCDPALVNRQDSRMWTPLHYSLISEYHGAVTVPFAKVKCLLKYGADPEIKATRYPLFYGYRFERDDFDSYELAWTLMKSHQYSEYLNTVKKSGKTVPQYAEDEVLYDAVAGEKLGNT